MNDERTLSANRGEIAKTVSRLTRLLLILCISIFLKVSISQAASTFSTMLSAETGTSSTAVYTGNYESNPEGEQPTAALIIDDGIDSGGGPIDVEPPEDDDDEPSCPANSKSYTVDNQMLFDLLFVLNGTRFQFSHAPQGASIVGEPRTINFAGGLTAAKFLELEQAQQQSCSTKADPDQCMLDWYQKMSEFAVHTYSPKYYSYVDFPNTFSNVTGVDYIPLPIRVVEKSVQSKWTKALTTLLALPIAVNVDKARCFINQIEGVVDNNAHKMELHNGQLELGMTLDSAGDPTLVCEGRAVALWGLHTWGWADELFPDIRLSNMRMAINLGGFIVKDDLPMYSFADVDVHADIDLNNIPGFGEDIIDFIKGFRDKAHTKVSEALEKKLMSNSLREAFGRVIVLALENQTHHKVERVCNVSTDNDTVTIEYVAVDKTGVATEWNPTLPYISPAY